MHTAEPPLRAPPRLPLNLLPQLYQINNRQNRPRLSQEPPDKAMVPLSMPPPRLRQHLPHNPNLLMVQQSPLTVPLLVPIPPVNDNKQRNNRDERRIRSARKRNVRMLVKPISSINRRPVHPALLLAKIQRLPTHYRQLKPLAEHARLQEYVLSVNIILGHYS